MTPTWLPLPPTPSPSTSKRARGRRAEAKLSQPKAEVQHVEASPNQRVACSQFQNKHKTRQTQVGSSGFESRLSFLHISPTRRGCALNPSGHKQQAASKLANVCIRQILHVIQYSSTIHAWSVDSLLMSFVVTSIQCFPATHGAPYSLDHYLCCLSSRIHLQRIHILQDGFIKSQRMTTYLTHFPLRPGVPLRSCMLIVVKGEEGEEEGG